MWSFAVVSLFGMLEAYPLPAAMIGTWTPETIPHAVLGPTRFIRKLHVSENKRTGEFWFSVIDGQNFRVSATTNEMQYCFGEVVNFPYPNPLRLNGGSEQAPFYIDKMTDTKVDFCWRGIGKAHAGMPTHKAGCQACDCAKITLELMSEDTLHFTFMMSPPVIHAHVEAKRSGPPPKMDFYKFFLGGRKCEFVNKTGFLPYTGDAPEEEESSVSSMHTCPVVINAVGDGLQSASPSEGLTSEGLTKECRQLDGMNWHFDKKNVPNVRLQYKKPLLRCWPCDVQYSVSAAIAENQYIGLGFKGMGYALNIATGHGPKAIRPNYFGMRADPLDEKRTGTAMALGHGSCFREMQSPNYVGSVVDVAEAYRRLKSTSVERRNGRTIVRFTVSQHVGRNSVQIDDFFGDPIQRSARVMWAIGDVSGDENLCNATLGYHTHNRGVAPLNWLSVGNTNCKYDPKEIDRSAEVVV